MAIGCDQPAPDASEIQDLASEPMSSRESLYVASEIGLFESYIFKLYETWPVIEYNHPSAFLRSASPSSD